MTEIRHTCDRCGRVIEHDRTLLKTASGPLLGRRDETDLCPGCAEAFVGWLAEEKPDPAATAASDAR